MASITIRKLSPEDKKRLRLRAAEHGRSMEEEARIILREALKGEEGPRSDLGEAIRVLLAQHGIDGITLPDVPREPMREPPKLG